MTPAEASGRSLAGRASDAIQLFVLSAFAVAQPLFDLLGNSAEFFAVRGSERADIVLFALAVTVVPPAVLFLLELLAGLADARARRALHLAFVALLAGAVALQALARIDVAPGSLLVVAAAALGAACLEKHVTLSRDDGGVDSAFSVEPDELARLVEDSRTAWTAVASGTRFGPTVAEEAVLRLRRSLYVVADVRAGDEVRGGQPLGRIVDLLGDPVETIEAPYDGVVVFRTTSAAVKPRGLLLALGA